MNFIIWFPIMENSSIFLFILVFLVGARKSTLMSISNRSGPYIFHQKMEKTRLKSGKIYYRMFLSNQSWHLSFIFNLFQNFLPVCTLTWHLNNYVSHHGISIIWKNENTTNAFSIRELFSAFTISWLYGMKLVINIKSHCSVILQSWKIRKKNQS